MTPESDGSEHAPTVPTSVVGLALRTVLAAIEETGKWIARLGGRRWQKLHWLIYPSAIAGVVHYYWKVKLDVTPPLIYVTVFAVLLAYRALKRMSKSPAHGASAAAR